MLMRKRPFLTMPHSPRGPEFPRGPRWAVRLVRLLPPLLLLIAAVGYCVRLNRLLLANLPPVASAEITRQIGHETHVGRVVYSTPDTLIVDSVEVSSRATYAQSQGESVVKADRVTIHYSLRALLFDSGNAAHALGDIVVERPTLLAERLSKNQFNFSDIIRPKPNQPPRKPFEGRIIVQDGTLHFRDYVAPARLGRRPAFNELDHVATTVDLHSDRFVYFTGSGQGAGGRLASFAVHGDASRLTAGRFRVAVQVTDADAAYWAGYFANFRQAYVTAGRADVDMTVARLGSRPPPGLPVDLAGRVIVRRVALALTAPQVRRLTVRNLAGSATFLGAGLTFRGTAAVGGQPIIAHGSLFDFARPQLAAAASSDRFDAERLAAAVPIVRWPSGLRLAPGAVTASVVGPVTQPTVSADIALPAAQYAGNRVADVRASGVFAGKTLNVSSLTFQEGETGHAALHGTIVVGQVPSIRLYGQAWGVNLAALHLPGTLGEGGGLGGQAEAQILADNIGHPFQIVANVSVARPHVRHTQLQLARARLVFAPGRGLTVSRALIQDAQGTVLLSGVIPAGVKNGRWDLNVAAAGLNLGALLQPYTSVAVGGLAYFDGRVQGPAAAPQAVGQVQLLNPRYRALTADVVSGAVTAGADGVQMRDVVVRRFPTAAHISGTVTRLASGDPRLNLGVTLSEAQLQDFLSLADQVAPVVKGRTRRVAALPAITGTAQGTFQIGGTVRLPRIAGQATVTDGTVGPYRVDYARVRASYGGDVVRLDEADLRAEGATLNARGTLGLKTGKLQAAFTGTGVDLNRFRDLTGPYADVTGLLDLSGRVGGTLKSPSVLASVTGRGVTVDGQAFAPFTLAGRYADGVFVKADAPWTLDIPSPSVTQPDIRYVVNDLRLALPTPQRPKRPAALTLDAAIPADAPEQVPHLIGMLRASRYAATPAGRKLLTRIEALPRPLAGTIAVPHLAVGGTLADPSVQAEVQAGGLSLGPSRVGGLKATVSFADPRNPQATLTATATDLVADGVPVTSVAVQASLADHVLTLSALRAASARALLEASGHADLNGGDIVANLDASNIPLSLLDPLLPQPAEERRSLTGELGSLSVSASGPARAPNLAASVNLTDPGLAVGLPGKPPRMTYGLDRVRSGAITLMTPVPGGTQVLSVSDLAAYKNGRPIASLSGSLPFRWHGDGSLLPGSPSGEPLHAALSVPDLAQLAPFVPTLDPKKVAGTLTASLDVTGSGEARRPAVKIDLTNGSLGFAGFDTALTKVNAHVTLAGDRLSVDSFTGASSKGGTFAVTGGGSLGAAGRADLRLTVKNLTLNESSRQNLLAKAFSTAFQGKINGSIGMAGPWKTPTISTPSDAPLMVTDASGTIPSAPTEAGPSAGPPPFDPNFDLTVQLGSPGKPVELSNALLQAFADGTVALTGRLSAPELRAPLNIERGQFILPPATRLRFIRSGEGNTVTLRYPVLDDQGRPGLQTRVNLTAQASVSVSQAQLAAYRPAIPGEVEAEQVPVGNTATTTTAFNQPQRYTIMAHIHGVLNDPKLPIDLESSPAGLSRQDMLIALTGAPGLSGLFGPDAQSALQTELAYAFSSVGLPILLSPLYNSIAATFGLTDFNVDYSPDSPILVTLSKQISPRLEVTYIRSIGASAPGAVSSITLPPEYTLKLSYGLTRRLQVSVSTDDQNNNTVALEGVLGF